MPFSLPNQIRLPPTSNVLEINKPQGWGGVGGGVGRGLHVIADLQYCYFLFVFVFHRPRNLTLFL